MKNRFPLFALASVLAVAAALAPAGFGADSEPKPPEPPPVRVENTAEILKRLDSIKIKEINFQNADIDAIIDFLMDESRRADPDGVGVHIVVRELPQGRNIRSLRLRDIKLMDVIKVIVDLANLRYVVEPKAVVIVPADSMYGINLETRTYPIDPSVVMRLIGRPSGGNVVPQNGERGIAHGEEVAMDLSMLAPYLEGLGVPFPRGTNVTLLTAFNRLVVTNNPKNLELLERLLDDLNVSQYQVSIETRVLRLPKKIAQGVFKDKLQAARTVLVTEETLRMLERLDDEMKIAVVCRPRVTTDFGKKATTKSVRQILYVTHYKLEDGKPMPQMGNCEVGTEMTVKPVLAADGYAINLSLDLKISSFLKMRTTNAVLPGFDKPVPMETPELASRTVSTNLTLQRDTTVMLPLLDDAPDADGKKDFVEVILINASINWPRLAKPQKAP